MQDGSVGVIGSSPWFSRASDAGDLLRPDRWARLLARTTALGLLFGVVGPYNSFTANPVTRLFYWIMLFWTGTLILWPSVALAARIGARRGFPFWFCAGAGGLIACVPLSWLASLGCSLFWPVRASGIRPLEWYAQTIVIALPVLAIMLWYERRPRPTARGDDMAPTIAARPAPGQVTPPSPFPDHLREAVLCLQMEDHHVRIHTVGRSRLHLAPLGQVAQELGSERGLQVHRSWWVARDAVRGWEAEGRSIVLLLTNGMRVPVARNRVAQLRARGWLDQADV